MSIVAYLLMASVTAAPQVEVTLLTGDQHSGELSKLAADELTISAGGENKKIPYSEVMEVRFKGSKPAQPAEKILFHVRLTDGTQMSCSQFTSSGTKAILESPVAGKMTIPLVAVANVRFETTDKKVRPEWDKLCERKMKRDFVVVKKKDFLDHIDGFVGDVGEKSLKFLLDGDEIPVRRSAKLFGIVYARRPGKPASPVCEISLGNGIDQLRVKQISWDGKQFSATLLAGAEFKLPLDAIQSLDFSLGKVRYLSQLEPREMKYTPYFDDSWTFRRDRNQLNGPLSVGGKTYARGLWIHSKTELRYRIGGDYRRFRAVMGIDDLVAANGEAHVHVVIKGDGKTLLETDVIGADKPRSLDLDVTGIRDLEILVDYGEHGSVSDHLDLADAKLIK